MIQDSHSTDYANVVNTSIKMRHYPPSLLIEGGVVTLLWDKEFTCTYPYGRATRDCINIPKEVYEEWIKEEYERIEDESGVQE